MQRFVFAGCILASMAIDTEGGLPPDRSPIFSDNELRKLASRIQCRDDLIVLLDGTQLTGKIQRVPTLHFGFGNLSFDSHQVAVVAFTRLGEKSQMKILTHDGQTLFGQVRDKIYLQQFGSTQGSRYVLREVDPAEINFILFEGRRTDPQPIRDSFYRLELANGDHLSVNIKDSEIRITDGWKEKKVLSKDIENLTFNGGLFGTLRNSEGASRELNFCFVKDPYLTIELPSTKQAFRIPWEQVQGIKKQEGNQFAKFVASERNTYEGPIGLSVSDGHLPNKVKGKQIQPHTMIAASSRHGAKAGLGSNWQELREQKQRELEMIAAQEAIKNEEEKSLKDEKEYLVLGEEKILLEDLEYTEEDFAFEEMDLLFDISDKELGIKEKKQKKTVKAPVLKKEIPSVTIVRHTNSSITDEDLLALVQPKSKEEKLEVIASASTEDVDLGDIELVLEESEIDEFSDTIGVKDVILPSPKLLAFVKEKLSEIRHHFTPEESVGVVQEEIPEVIVTETDESDSFEDVMARIFQEFGEPEVDQQELPEIQEVVTYSPEPIESIEIETFDQVMARILAEVNDPVALMEENEVERIAMQYIAKNPKESLAKTKTKTFEEVLANIHHELGITREGIVGVQEVLIDDRPKEIKPYSPGEMEGLEFHSFDEVMAALIGDAAYETAEPINMDEVEPFSPGSEIFTSSTFDEVMAALIGDAAYETAEQINMDEVESFSPGAEIFTSSTFGEVMADLIGDAAYETVEPINMDEVEPFSPGAEIVASGTFGEVMADLIGDAAYETAQPINMDEVEPFSPGAEIVASGTFGEVMADLIGDAAYETAKPINMDEVEPFSPGAEIVASGTFGEVMADLIGDAAYEAAESINMDEVEAYKTEEILVSGQESFEQILQNIMVELAIEDSPEQSVSEAIAFESSISQPIAESEIRFAEEDFSEAISLMEFAEIDRIIENYEFKFNQEETIIADTGEESIEEEVFVEVQEPEEDLQRFLVEMEELAVSRIIQQYEEKTAVAIVPDNYQQFEEMRAKVLNLISGHEEDFVSEDPIEFDSFESMMASISVSDEESIAELKDEELEMIAMMEWEDVEKIALQYERRIVAQEKIDTQIAIEEISAKEEEITDEIEVADEKEMDELAIEEQVESDQKEPDVEDQLILVRRR